MTAVPDPYPYNYHVLDISEGVPRDVAASGMQGRGMYAVPTIQYDATACISFRWSDVEEALRVGRHANDRLATLEDTTAEKIVKAFADSTQLIDSFHDSLRRLLVNDGFEGDQLMHVGFALADTLISFSSRPRLAPSAIAQWCH